ncbi:conserved hypothetical protein [Talaromyces stipitatus ATCC 10500]|uniref:6-phosphogluconolactonase n=1 Tax=Talaromyces stipitatus (strain ATCC 10500 / CBS 375.48 / QM 6759 / NRRL 1006) TaxID=441959 RepID=B8LYY3_TALSN|nr:uncharacterized protein TSTA_069120 [Talaromyces stipitatus ATCC 10500]EED23491.1 conserved hypothetical protein [Talaromyces stipitatus ATCC 10500]
MKTITSLLLFSATSLAKTLYVSHYDGHVYTLTYNTTDPNPETSLTLASTLTACGSMPSWLELDADAYLLYCIDETGTSQTSGNGSLTSFDISDVSRPAVVSETGTLAGGVASVIYEAGEEGEKFIAIAHYEGSSVSTFPLPLTNDTTALQTFLFTLTGPVTVPDRQDAPHPHSVFLDPTASYILSPDLGADLIRIFAINDSDGTLTECEAHKTVPGDGPRHGVFNQEGNRLYITNELADTVSTYSVSYKDDCTCGLSLKLRNEIVPSPTGKLPTSYVAEIRIPNNSTNVYVTVRGDQSFAPDDSIAFLDPSPNPTGLVAKNLTSSFGSYPRTLVISEDGSLVAVGNQKSSSVAIVQRDVETGELGELVGNLQVGDVEAGLSSVIWGSD